MKKFTRRELGTVLAALRYWQHMKLVDREARVLGGEFDIATDGGDIRHLSAEEVDGLCLRLNRL